MLTATEECTSEFQLVEGDRESDLDIMPIEWLLPNAEVSEEWEEGEEDKDVDLVNLCRSADRDSNGSEDSDGIYGEKDVDMEDEEG
ncbi:hypothetical protein HOY80DRAFT_1027554 [Tuber brumale]|nr:hypothetical protein HOY80DRAFT_1027554 [Tuber brumale]